MRQCNISRFGVRNVARSTFAFALRQCTMCCISDLNWNTLLKVYSLQRSNDDDDDEIAPCNSAWSFPQLAVIVVGLMDGCARQNV